MPAAEPLEEPTAAAPATGAVEKLDGAADSGATSDGDSAKLAKRVERFGRIAPITENEAAEKMAKRKAKFGLPEKVNYLSGILVRRTYSGVHLFVFLRLFVVSL